MTITLSPTRAVPLIDDPSEITPRWLTAVLRRSGAIGDESTVTICDATRFAEDRARRSRLYRVRVGYESVEAGGPSSLVVKLGTTDPGQHAIAKVLGLYRREAFVYNELRRDLPYRVPRCHLAAVSDDGGHTTLVLEDLGRCRTIDQTIGASWNVILDCVDAMAAQHTAFSDEALLGELAVELWPLAHPVHRAALPKRFDAAWAVAKAALGDQLDAELVHFGDRWSSECGPLLDRLQSHPTLLHGDWRADNLFYDGNELIVSDFQISGIGAGAYDLAHFVSQSVDPDERTGRDRGIVERYVRRLASHGVHHDVEAVWEEYRIALLVCLTHPVTAFRTWSTDNDHRRAVTEAMLLRSADAIRATGALEVR